MFNEVPPAALLLPDAVGLLLLWAVIWGLACVTHAIRIVLHSLFLLTVVVAALLLHTLSLKCILLILCLQVTLKLAELGLNLVFPILADHLDRTKPLLCLSQFVLFLLFRASGLFDINALIDTTSVTMSHLKVVLMPSLSTGCGSSARIHHGECGGVHERILSQISLPGRRLLVNKDRILSLQLRDVVLVMVLSLYHGPLGFKFLSIEHFLDFSCLECLLELFLNVHLSEHLSASRLVAHERL